MSEAGEEVFQEEVQMSKHQQELALVHVQSHCQKKLKISRSAFLKDQQKKLGTGQIGNFQLKNKKKFEFYFQKKDHEKIVKLEQRIGYKSDIVQFLFTLF